MVMNKSDDAYALGMLDDGYTVPDIKEVLPRASKSQLYRKKGWHDLYGQLYSPDALRIPPGPKRLITSGMEDYLVELMAGTPDIWQDELIWELLVKFDVIVHQSTMSRALKRKQFTKKVAVRIAGQRDPIARALFEEQLQQYRPEQLVYVDESNAGEKTFYRRHAWSYVGLPARIVSLLKSSIRISILPALTSEGYLPTSTLVVEGSITGEIFENWLEFVLLPQMNRYTGPTSKHSVLVMDNCSTHHGETVDRLCREKGIVLLYLPSYSPD